MIKEITYTGLSARPFDNSSTDGDLSIAANCINEKGCIQPVLPPGLAQTIKTEPQDTDDALDVSSMYEVLATHTCEGTTNYIIKRIKTSTLNPSNVEEQLYTLEKDKSTATLLPVSNGKATPTLAVYAKIYSVSVIGNILTALTSDGKQYILYKESKYILLGSEPPRINLQFCLEQVCEPTYEEKQYTEEISGINETIGYVDVNGYYKPFSNLLEIVDVNSRETLQKKYIRSYKPVIKECSDWFHSMFFYHCGTSLSSAFLFKTFDNSTEKSDSNKKELTQAVFGAYQKEMVDRVEKKGYFNQPFLIRYAYKLYNGDYAFFSPPVLMMPSMNIPYCRTIWKDEKTSDGTYSGDIVFDYIKCQLRYAFDNINNTADLENWNNWSSIIKSIDVFISSPIYTWDTDGTIEEQVAHNDWVDDEYVHKMVAKPQHNPAGEEIRPKRVITNAVGEYINDTFGEIKISDTVSYLESLDDPGVGTFIGSFIKFNENNYDENDKKTPIDELPKSADNAVKNWFIPKIPYSTMLSTGVTVRGVVVVSRGRDVLKFPKNENFYKDVVSVQNFYKIAEIDIPSNDNGFTDGLKLLKLIKKDLSNLEVFERISDDYYSKSKIISRAQFTFNNRINLLGYRKYCPKVFIEELLPFTGYNPYSPEVVKNLKLFFDIYYYNSGRQCHCRYEQLTNRLLYINLPQEGEDDETTQNRWRGLFKYLCFPDPNVFRIDLRYVINTGGESATTYEKSLPLVSLKMKRSDFLNGSYYFDDFKEPPQEGSSLSGEVSECDYYEEKNKVYTSNVNNPFIFNAVNINTIGHGELYALSSTTQPLSQGQFGLYPLYAFASDGVWALETNSEGGYSAKSILSRDVIVHDSDGMATPPLQLENSIIYACDRGLILLSGSETQCISEVIDERFPVNFLSFQSFGKLTDGLNKDTLNLMSFKQFINGAKYAYDYGNERVWVFNTNHSYAYVFSLKSKLWGIADCNLNAYFSAFPDSFATTRDAKIVDLTNSDVTTAAGFFMTRPFALQMNDIHKTIYSVYQRGLFHNTVNTVLYGSNDLVNWYVIGSSVDHRILNIAGTPYKYFRVASRFNLSGNENILGASIEVNPKMTNKLR